MAEARSCPWESLRAGRAQGRGKQSSVGQVELEVPGSVQWRPDVRGPLGLEAQLRGLSVQGGGAQPQALGSTGRSR